MKTSLQLAVVLAAMLPVAGFADWKYGGHVEYQYTYTDYRADDLAAVRGANPAHDDELNVRLKAETVQGAWDAAVHYELLAMHGDLQRVGLAGALPDDSRRLFDLTHTVTNRNDTSAVHRLDRLAIGHSSGEYVVRFGRQALSWGNGLVFHPLDFINPFAPTAIVKDYKTGDDMLYTQRTFANGGDVQAIVVPRRDPVTHDVESDESTYAVKLRTHVGEFDLDIIGARHFGDSLAGLGVVRGIGGAVWRFDARYTDTAGALSLWSFVTNLDYSWTWGGKNTYGYIEYFRNGDGETDSLRYAAPNTVLAARIARGELYNLARDYAAVGLQVELHPLFNVFGNVIRNLNDGSSFLQLRGVYDWLQNAQLMMGANLATGDRGDEYGGIPVAGTSAFLANGRAFYVRMSYYF